MARHPSPFGSPVEFTLLESIWKNESRTVRELIDEHYPSRTPSDQATIQKFLKRLEEKGLIERDQSTIPNVIVAKYGRNELAKREFRALAKKYGMKPTELAKL